MPTYLTSVSRRAGLLTVARVIAVACGFPIVSRVAAALPGCPQAGDFAPGLWIGTFAVRSEWQWAGPGRDGLPVTRQSEARALGSFALPVPDPSSPEAGTLAGRAWASWQTYTREFDEAGNGQVIERRGWLSGGELTLADERPLVPGARFVWQGAWWTASAGDSLGTGFRQLEAGTPVGPAGDGPLRPQPAASFDFLVDAVDCGKVTGSVAAHQFWYPGTGPGPEEQPIVIDNRFTLVLDYPARAP